MPRKPSVKAAQPQSQGKVVPQRRNAVLPLVEHQQRQFLKWIREGSTIPLAAQALGYTEKQIRALWSRDPAFRAEYEKAAAHPRIALLGKGYKMAMDGNVPVLIYLMKTMCGLVEPKAPGAEEPKQPNLHFHIGSNATVEDASAKYEQFRSATDVTTAVDEEGNE